MKKIRFLLLIAILLMISNVRAVDKCEKNELNRLKELAEKIEFSYDYEIKEERNSDEDYYKYAEFSIKATNLNSELKTLVIYNYYSGNYLEFNEANDGVLKGFNEGEKVNIVVKAYTNNDCVEKTVLTKTINLPYFNELSDSEICQENPNFKYCSVLLDKKINNETFINELEKDFNSNKKVEKNKEGEINSPSSINVIYIIVAAIIVVLLILIVILTKKKRRKEAI